MTKQPTPLTPETVSAILRDPDSPYYPSRITVFCDECGVEETGEFMVREDMNREQRLAVARQHLVANAGWEHTADGDDFCPEHAGSPTEEQPTPDRPFTDADLRAEAARQHAEGAWDADLVTVGEQMSDQPCPPTDEPGPGLHTWGDLTEDEYDDAQQKIHDLIDGAADTSAWAVQLGADGLKPSTEHEITIDAGRPIARIHFAFAPDMPEEMRAALVTGLGQAIDDADASLDEPEAADSDSDVFDLISVIASQLQDATDGAEYHAVGLIYDLAMGRTTIADARAQLAELTFRHA